MKLDDGEQKVNSIMGSICSLILALVIGLYAYQKMDVLISKKDVDVALSISEDHYTPDDVFNHDNGLSIAVAFTAYDNEENWSLDNSYGELVFVAQEWADKQDGSIESSTKRINSHVCSRDELGLNRSGQTKPSFLPVVESSRLTLNRY